MRAIIRRRLPPFLIALLSVLSLAPRVGAEEPSSPPPDSVAASPAEAYIDSLLADAERQKLCDDRYWRILLHYKKGLFGVQSVVDDPKFFADPGGKHDPGAELRATIRSFFSPAVEGEKHPVCRYVARYEWLREKLGIDESRLPVPRCQEFEDLLAQIQPESATLIFPTSHMNSPASMYGHTLLTIETASKSRLLSYAVNYSALTPGSVFAPVYFAKGIFGGYPGYFSILPYYAKLQEYSDVNDRDIWEYPLNLDRAEVRRLIMHISEMDGIYTNYYFFGENCSYGLLFLLEAARPSLHLTDQFGWWVIPVDTIRAVKKSGLITGAVYRPSKSTKVEYLANPLSKDRCKQAWEVAEGRREPAELLTPGISRGDQIRMCDLASEYLQYIYTKGDVPKEVYQSRFLRTLEARSSLGGAEEWRESIPPPGRPDEGHRSSRLGVGGGTADEEPFAEVRFRPAYHGLLDNESGYKRGSQIIFLDTAVRYYSRLEKVKIDSIDLIDIVSIAPRDRFFKHVSWKVNTGFFPKGGERRRDDLVWGLNPGLGLAYDSGVLGLSYAMLETDVRAGSAFARRFALGGGASAGLIKDLAGWWKVQLGARYLDYPLGDESRQLRLSVGQGVRLGTNLSVSATVERSTEDDDSTWETRVSGNVFL